ADQQASSDGRGAPGACACSPSSPPSLTQRGPRAADRKPNASRATDPLYGTGTARPAGTTYLGSGVSSSAGEITETSCPKPMSASGSSSMCSCTPPGASQV